MKSSKVYERPLTWAEKRKKDAEQAKKLRDARRRLRYGMEWLYRGSRGIQDKNIPLTDNEKQLIEDVTDYWWEEASHWSWR